MLDGEIGPQHFHNVFGSFSLNVIVCQFQSVDVHVGLNKKSCLSEITESSSLKIIDILNLPPKQ